GGGGEGGGGARGGGPGGTDKGQGRGGRKLEKQEPPRQHDRRKGRAEHARHAGGRPAGEQDLPLGRRHADDLTDERSERAAGHDDRSLGAERTAGADGDGRRRRLGNRSTGPAA